MHSYQVDEAVRTRVFLLCATLAILFAYLATIALEAIHLRAPWWLEYPSPLGLFAILVALYNRYLWRRRPFSVIPWFRIPCIAGDWTARLRTSHDAFAEDLHAKVAIRQTGSRLSVSLDARDSTSQSLSASLLPLETISDFQLTYHFLNSPKPPAPAGMVPHYGVAVLRFSVTPTTLQGEYFSGRGRHEHGEMLLIPDKQAA